VAVSAFWGNGNKNNVDAFRNEEYGKEEEWEVSEESEEEKKEELEHGGGREGGNG
jgi:hypothetical protein